MVPGRRCSEARQGAPAVVPGGPWRSLEVPGGPQARFSGPGAGSGGPRGSPEVVPGRRCSEARQGAPAVVPGGPWRSLEVPGGPQARFSGPGAGPGGPRGSLEVVPGRRCSEAGRGPPRTPSGGPWWSLEVPRPCFRGLAPALGVRGGPRGHHRVRGGEPVAWVPGSSARPARRLSSGLLSVLRAWGSAIEVFFSGVRGGPRGSPVLGDPRGTPWEPAPSLPVPLGPSCGLLSAPEGVRGGPRGSRGSAGAPTAEAEAPWSASSWRAPASGPWSSRPPAPWLFPPCLPLKNPPERFSNFSQNESMEPAAGWK